MYRLILSLILAAPLAQFAADVALPADASSPAPAASFADFDTLQRAAAQCKAAMLALNPIKEKLVNKIEKLKAQDDAASDATQFLIGANEKRLESFIAQERQLRQSLASIEARLNELRHDPEQGAMIQAHELLTAATVEQEALLKGLPQVPDSNGK